MYSKQLISIDYKRLYFTTFSILLLFVNFYINITISKMSPLGALSSSLGIILLIYSFYKNNISGIIVFFILNSIIGPFSLINLHTYGYGVIGRLDYIIAFLLTIYYINKYQKVNITVLSIFLLTIIGYLISSNINENIGLIASSYIGSILISYLLCIIVKNTKTYKFENYNLTFKLLIFVFLINIILAYLQVFITDLHIRHDAHMGQTVLFDILINRPTGLYGSAYVFSLATLFYSYYIYIYLNDDDKKIFSKFLYIVIFPVISLSSSAVGLGIAVYFFIFLFISRITKDSRILFILVSILILMIMICNFNISDFGKSSATKLLMWQLVFDNIVYSSNIFEILFGHGIDSARYLALEMPEFIKNYNYGNISYDHEILTRDGSIMVHNVFIQILYEFGILMLLLLIPIIKILFFVLKYKQFSMISLLFMSSILNYLFHNGIFSVVLIFPMLLMYHSIKYKQYKLLK